MLIQNAIIIYISILQILMSLIIMNVLLIVHELKKYL